MLKRRLRFPLILILLLLAVYPAYAQQTITTTVTRVVDGDTIETPMGKVRFIGMDTPETVHPDRGVEPWGPEASEFTKKLLPPGTPVTLKLDVQPKDHYGRLLAYVYMTDGRMVNALLLKAGLAQLMTIPPNVAHVDEFRQLQTDAREAHRGMWGTQEVSASRAPPAIAKAGSDTVYITRTGSKYHRAGCRYLSKSCIPISRADAVAQGYTPCKVCKP